MVTTMTATAAVRPVCRLIWTSAWGPGQGAGCWTLDLQQLQGPVLMGTSEIRLAATAHLDVRQESNH